MSAWGEWVIIALPYPTGTTFTVTRGYQKTPVTAASSFAELGPLKYFYDPTSNHLFVKVYVMSGDSSISTTFGLQYPAFQSYWTQYFVQASCSKSACLGPNLGIPAPVPLLEDQYVAALQACQVTPAITYSGNGEGIAYFSLDPATKLLTYNIYQYALPFLMHRACLLTLHSATLVPRSLLAASIPLPLVLLALLCITSPATISFPPSAARCR